MSVLLLKGVFCMKRFLAILLVLLLCCSAAAAEVTSKKLETNDASLIGPLNLLVVQGEDRLEHLADTEMNLLSDGYYSVSYDNTANAIKVREPEKGLYGTIGRDGKVLVPVQYDELDALSDRWTAGIMLTESTGENYDYQTLLGEKKYYLVDTVDIWYLDTKLATLTREEYRSAAAFGDYLCIRDRNDAYTFVNKAFEKPAGEVTYSQEYSEARGAVTHCGTGLPAFTEGCTLTAEEVRQRTYIFEDYSAKTKTLKDLQGNVLADLSAYDSCTLDRDTGLITIRNEEKKKGLLDAEGKELFPCLYDELDFDLAKAARTGWIEAVRDGKAGFVSLKDGSESGFEYQQDAVKLKGYFLKVEDPKDGKILISPEGELTARFAEAEPAYQAPYAVVKESADSSWTVIGLKGENVLPDAPEVNGDYGFSFSDDGSLILVYAKDYSYTLYTVTNE